MLENPYQSPHCYREEPPRVRTLMKWLLSVRGNSLTAFVLFGFAGLPLHWMMEMQSWSPLWTMAVCGFLGAGFTGFEFRAITQILVIAGLTGVIAIFGAGWGMVSFRFALALAALSAAVFVVSTIGVIGYDVLLLLQGKSRPETSWNTTRKQQRENPN